MYDRFLTTYHWDISDYSSKPSCFIMLVRLITQSHRDTYSPCVARRIYDTSTLFSQHFDCKQIAWLYWKDLSYYIVQVQEK